MKVKGKSLEEKVNVIMGGLREKDLASFLGLTVEDIRETDGESLEEDVKNTLMFAVEEDVEDFLYKKGY